MNEFGLNIQEILEQNKQEIVNSAIRQIKESIASSVAYGTNREVNEAISAFVKKEILPEVNKYLAENKQSLLNSYTEVISESLGLIGEHMLANAQKKIASKWQADEIVKKLFF